MATSTLRKVLPPDEPTSSPRLTFVEHLDELRRRLLICLGAVVVTSSLALWKAGWLVGWLKRPAGDQLARLAFFSPTEALAAYVQVGVLAGVALALPILCYQAWAFVRPALTWRERTYGVAFVWWGSLCFVLGAEVGYGVLLPFFLKFLLSVGSPHLAPVISVNQYLSFVLGVILLCGAVFELPVVVFLLSRMGLVSAQMLRRHRLLAMLILLIVAAIVTPTTDAISLFLLALPLALLYELSALIAAGSTPRRSRPPQPPHTPARPT